MTLSGFAAVMGRETSFETVGADQLVESAADLARKVLSMIRERSPRDRPCGSIQAATYVGCWPFADIATLPSDVAF